MSRAITFGVVHHTDTDAGATVADIREMHLARGWSDIGYHWLLRLDPAGGWRPEPGRPEAVVGAHDNGENVGSIGVAIAGRYHLDPVPPAAWFALLSLLADRSAAHGIPASNWYGHREHETPATATACPGFDPARLREALAELLGLSSSPSWRIRRP